MTGFRLGGNKKEKLSPPGAAKPSALVDEVSAPRNFGIKNYLHQFYMTPTDELESSAWYLLPPPPAQRRGLLLCRMLTFVGLFMLVAGAVCIIVGYTWKSDRHFEQSMERFVLYKDSDGGYYLPRDKLEIILQDPMKTWKMTGFIMFTIGGVLLAFSLMVPTVASCIGSQRLAAFASSDNSPNEPPVRVFPHTTNPPVSSGPVPVMEEIAKVQPTEKRASPTMSQDLLDDQP